jgi:hypothetical protein
MPRFFSRVLAVACLFAGLWVGGPVSVQAAELQAATFPLHVDNSSRTLVGSNGQLFMVQGDAAWSLIVQLNSAEVGQYLDDRRTKGLNAVLVNLIEHQFSGNNPPSANRAGQQPFNSCLSSCDNAFSTPINNDFGTPNPAYFDYAESVVAQAQARGMLVLLAPMYLGFQGGSQGWFLDLKANGVSRAAAYGHYVGQRFAKYPNILWVQGGDTGPVAQSQDATAEINAVANGIRQGEIDAGFTPHLQTAHAARGHSSLDDYPPGSFPWLNVDAIYTSCETAQSLARAEWTRGTNMPFFHIEGIYENEPVGSPSPIECQLNEMVYPVLLGARGHVFGNRPIWLFDSGWPTALNAPGSLYWGFTAGILRSRQAWAAVPDTGQTIVTANQGTLNADDFTAAATTPTSVLIYVPTTRASITVNTSALPGGAGGTTGAKWFNPRTGQESDAGTFTNAGPRDFAVPAGAPWLLILDNAAVTAISPIWHPFFAVDPRETPMVGDFNGDGKVDIITFTRDNPLAFGDVYVSLSNGHEFVDKFGRSGLSDKWNDWFAISHDEQVVIGDFDGDGRDDIATWLGTTTRQIYVALSFGTGMTESIVWLNSIGFDPSDILAAGDANGDGLKDLVLFARKQGKVYVALSHRTGFDQPTVWHNFFAVSTFERPRVADVNGDGKADIVTFATNSPTAFGDVYVAVSNGVDHFVDLNGVLDNSTKWHDFFAIDPTQQIRIGDINGDRRADFFTFLPPPFAQAYTVLSMGDHMGDNVLWREPVAPRTLDVPFVGDANGDGRSDIIVFAQSEGKVYVSLGR